MDARPQQLLRPTNSVDRSAQLRPERSDMRGCSIGQRMLCLGPDEFIRVEFWSVRGEAMNMKPLMLLDEVTDDDASVDGAAIPKEHNRPTQVPKEVSQESDDLHTCDIDRVESEEQAETLAGWGHGHAGDDGNPIPAIAVLENRGLPNRCPGPADMRDEEQSAFVEEYEMGPKSLGFFLYAANRVSSNVQWRSRPAVAPAAPASGKSNPIHGVPATHVLDGNASRSVSRSAWLRAAGSTGRSSIPRTGIPLPATATSAASAMASISGGGRRQVWGGVPSIRPCDEPGPSVPPNLSKNSESQRLIDRLCRTEAERWPASFVSVAARGFLEVSCLIR